MVAHGEDRLNWYNLNDHEQEAAKQGETGNTTELGYCKLLQGLGQGKLWQERFYHGVVAIGSKSKRIQSIKSSKETECTQCSNKVRPWWVGTMVGTITGPSSVWVSPRNRLRLLISRDFISFGNGSTGWNIMLISLQVTIFSHVDFAYSRSDLAAFYRRATGSRCVVPFGNDFIDTAGFGLNQAESKLTDCIQPWKWKTLSLAPATRAALSTFLRNCTTLRSLFPRQCRRTWRTVYSYPSVWVLRSRKWVARDQTSN